MVEIMEVGRVDKIRDRLVEIARQQGGYLTLSAVIELLRSRLGSEIQADQVDELYEYLCQELIQLVDELPEGTRAIENLLIREIEVAKKKVCEEPQTTDDDWGALQELWSKASEAEFLEYQYDDDLVFQLIEYAEQNDGNVPYQLITAITEEKRLTCWEVEDLCCFLQESGLEIENQPGTGEVGDQEYNCDNLECMELWPYLQEVRKIPHLSSQEERELCRRRDLGDSVAFERLWVSQLRHAIVIARYMQGRGLPLIDLIQEANLGLHKAIERFDPQYRKRLFQYASLCIHQAVARALANQARFIRLPVHMGGRIAAYYETCGILAERLGREPKNEEVAAEMCLPIVTINDLGMALEEPLSLDKLLQDNDFENNGSEEESVSFPIYYCTDQDVEHQVEEHSMAEIISDLLNTITDRERMVLKLRFGLQDGRPHTLEKVGQIFGVTRERIRQIEAKAMRKLRHPSRTRKIQGF